MSKSYYQTYAIPKPEPRKRVKAQKDREDAKQLRAFRDACWERQIAVAGGGIIPGDGYWSFCESCMGPVFERGYRLGQVHHKISRRHKSSRYDPSNGELLCRKCHNERHGREF